MQPTFAHPHWGFQNLLEHPVELYLFAELYPSLFNFAYEIHVISLQNPPELIHQLRKGKIRYLNEQTRNHSCVSEISVFVII